MAPKTTFFLHALLGKKNVVITSFKILKLFIKIDGLYYSSKCAELKRLSKTSTIKLFVQSK
jgi:hypothetical protein